MNNTKKQQNYRSDSFFEAFKELGSDTKKAVKSIGTDVISQINPLNWDTPNFSGQSEDPSFYPEYNQQTEREKARREKAQLNALRRQEKMVYSRKEEELKAQINAIQEELRKIVAEVGEFAEDIELAIEQSVVNPGVYHINFFNKLRQILVLLRKKIHDSHTWMHTVNARAHHKSIFWGNVKKSGTKYMLSQERTLATQTG